MTEPEMVFAQCLMQAHIADRSDLGLDGIMSKVWRLSNMAIQVTGQHMPVAVIVTPQHEMLVPLGRMFQSKALMKAVPDLMRAKCESIEPKVEALVFASSAWFAAGDSAEEIQTITSWISDHDGDPKDCPHLSLGFVIIGRTPGELLALHSDMYESDEGAALGKPQAVNAMMLLGNSVDWLNLWETKH